jgi:hypothetical protein
MHMMSDFPFLFSYSFFFKMTFKEAYLSFVWTNFLNFPILLAITLGAAVAAGG